MRVWGADGDVKVGHGESQFLSMMGVCEDVGVEADGVISDGMGHLDGGG